MNPTDPIPVGFIFYGFLVLFCIHENKKPYKCRSFIDE